MSGTSNNIPDRASPNSVPSADSINFANNERAIHAANRGAPLPMAPNHPASSANQPRPQTLQRNASRPMSPSIGQNSRSIDTSHVDLMIRMMRVAHYAANLRSVLELNQEDNFGQSLEIPLSDGVPVAGPNALGNGDTTSNQNATAGDESGPPPKVSERPKKERRN